QLGARVVAKKAVVATLGQVDAAQRHERLDREGLALLAQAAARELAAVLLEDAERLGRVLGEQRARPAERAHLDADRGEARIFGAGRRRRRPGAQVRDLG